LFVCLFDGVLTPLTTIFQLYRCVQFIGGRNQRTRRKSLNCRKSLTKLLTFQDIHIYMLGHKSATVFDICSDDESRDMHVDDLSNIYETLMKWIQL
jgi:hypothetical protein